MANYATIESGVVENIIVWDGTTPYNPGPNVTLVLLPDNSSVTMGNLYDATNGFTAPPEPTAGIGSPVTQ